MRLEIHYAIGKTVCNEMKDQGLRINERLFLLGNVFPDLVQSYIWRRHEYQHSRNYIKRKMDMLKKRPMLFSFHLGVLTHYICDYFCYPHSAIFDKGFMQHVIYELKQKIPSRTYKTVLDIRSFSIEELDRFVSWYESIRDSFDDDSDFHIASSVASNFMYSIQTAY